MCEIWGPGVGEAALLRRVRWHLGTGTLLPFAVQAGLGSYSWCLRHRRFAVRSPSYPGQSSPPAPGLLQYSPVHLMGIIHLMSAHESPAVSAVEIVFSAAEGVTGLSMSPVKVQ